MRVEGGAIEFIPLQVAAGLKKLHEVCSDGVGIAALDDNAEGTNMYDVKLAAQLLGDGGKDVALLKSHVGWEILFGGKVGGRVIEAVES